MPLITLPSGRQFAALDGESVLDAALRNEVAVAYSCRTGRCSTCKGRLRAGETQALHEELGLTPSERDAGWILTCVRSAVSDVSLQVEDLGQVRLPLVKTLPCKIDRLEQVSPNVLRVVLRLPPAAVFSHLPGQYVDVIGPAGLRRSYSIANSSTTLRQIELHVARVDAGEMSSFWFDKAAVNALLRLSGPLGTFFLRDVAGLDLVFLATGTGIAPVKAMLEGLGQLPAAQRPDSVTVYWGGRTSVDLYWTPPPLDMPYRYVPVLSRADGTWPGARGHVQRAFLADRPLLKRSVVYACGSDAMIHSANEALAASGLPEGRFFSDAFVCSAAA